LFAVSLTTFILVDENVGAIQSFVQQQLSQGGYSSIVSDEFLRNKFSLGNNSQTIVDKRTQSVESEKLLWLLLLVALKCKGQVNNNNTIRKLFMLMYLTVLV